MAVARRAGMVAALVAAVLLCLACLDRPVEPASAEFAAQHYSSISADGDGGCSPHSDCVNLTAKAIAPAPQFAHPAAGEVCAGADTLCLPDPRSPLTSREDSGGAVDRSGLGVWRI